jgi:DNA-binding transcriptional regulator GbsR (MarR family)
MSQPDILKNVDSIKDLQEKSNEVAKEINTLTKEWESIYEQLLAED